MLLIEKDQTLLDPRTSENFIVDLWGGILSNGPFSKQRVKVFLSARCLLPVLLFFSSSVFFFRLNHGPPQSWGLHQWTPKKKKRV